MSEFMWGVTYRQPSRAVARKMDAICRAEGGRGFEEVNVREGSCPGINNGRYQGWFSGPNHGGPHDQELVRRVADRIQRECGC